MSKLEVDAIEPQSGTTLTIGASGDTITIPSGATFASVGIDDNATSTAITIDSSENVGIKTTSPKGDGLSIGTTDATAFISPGGSNNSLTLTTTGANGVMRFYTQSGSDGNRATTESMRIDTSGNLKFDSGYGSVATAYGCRAWVNFNGTGTPSIRDSGNISSITDHGTGDFSMNFTTNLPDNDYAVSGSIGNDGPTTNTTAFNLNGSLATGSFRVHTASNGSTGSAYNDFAVNTFMVMR